MDTKGVFGLAGIVLIATSLSGCVGQMLLDSAAQSVLDSETPESTGKAPANYRGHTCSHLASEREWAIKLINYDGGDRGDREYLAKQGRWQLSSVEQVEREQGCLAGTTSRQAGEIDYVMKHPESASQFNLPPGALTPAISSSVPSTAAQVSMRPTIAADGVTAAPPVRQSATSVGAMYCTAALSTQHTYGATVSPVKLIAGAANNMQPSLKGYIAKVKQKQPSVWGDFNFNTPTCAPGAMVCMVEAEGPTGKTQNAFQFCHSTQAKADAELSQMRQGDPQAVVVDWP